LPAYSSWSPQSTVSSSCLLLLRKNIGHRHRHHRKAKNKDEETHQAAQGRSAAIHLLTNRYSLPISTLDMSVEAAKPKASLFQSMGLGGSAAMFAGKQQRICIVAS